MSDTEEDLPIAQSTTNVGGHQNYVTRDCYNFNGPVTFSPGFQSSEDSIADHLQIPRIMPTQPSTDGDTGIDMAIQTESSEAGQSSVCSHDSKCLLRDPKKRKRKRRSRSRSSSKRRKEKQMLNKVVPNALFQSLKYNLCKATSESNLANLKGICKEDFRKHDLNDKQMDKASTPDEFFNELEKCNLFGEDNLFFVQWCFDEIGLTSANEATERYAQKREALETEPLVLFGRSGKPFGKDVEIRIRGNIRHMNMTDVNVFKDVISKRLGIPKKYINVRAVGIGSVIFVIQMPVLGVNRLREAVARKDTWLWEEKILDIHIEGEDCVKVQDEYAQSIRLLNRANDAHLETDHERTANKANQGGVTQTCGAQAKSEHKESSDTTEEAARLIQLKRTRSPSSTRDDIHADGYSNCLKRPLIYESQQTHPGPNNTCIQQHQQEYQQQPKQDFQSAFPKITILPKECEAEEINEGGRGNVKVKHKSKMSTDCPQQTSLDANMDADSNKSTDPHQQISINTNKSTDSHQQTRIDTNKISDDMHTNNFLEEESATGQSELMHLDEDNEEIVNNQCFFCTDECTLQEIDKTASSQISYESEEDRHTRKQSFLGVFDWSMNLLSREVLVPIVILLVLIALPLLAFVIVVDEDSVTYIRQTCVEQCTWIILIVLACFLTGAIVYKSRIKQRKCCERKLDGGYRYTVKRSRKLLRVTAIISIILCAFCGLSMLNDVREDRTIDINNTFDDVEDSEGKINQEPTIYNSRKSNIWMETSTHSQNGRTTKDAEESIEYNCLPCHRCPEGTMNRHRKIYYSSAPFHNTPRTILRLNYRTTYPSKSGLRSIVSLCEMGPRMPNICLCPLWMETSTDSQNGRTFIKKDAEESIEYNCLPCHRCPEWTMNQHPKIYNSRMPNICLCPLWMETSTHSQNGRTTKERYYKMIKSFHGPCQCSADKKINQQFTTIYILYNSTKPNRCYKPFCPIWMDTTTDSENGITTEYAEDSIEYNCVPCHRCPEGTMNQHHKIYNSRMPNICLCPLWMETSTDSQNGRTTKDAEESIEYNCLPCHRCPEGTMNQHPKIYNSRMPNICLCPLWMETSTDSQNGSTTKDAEESIEYNCLPCHRCPEGTMNQHHKIYNSRMPNICLCPLWMETSTDSQNGSTTKEIEELQMQMEYMSTSITSPFQYVLIMQITMCALISLIGVAVGYSWIKYKRKMIEDDAGYYSVIGPIRRSMPVFSRYSMYDCYIFHEDKASSIVKSEIQDKAGQEHVQPPHPAGITLHRPGYYTIPSLEELAKMTDDNGECKVKDLTIGREGYGSVFYPGETILTGMNLDEIVHFNHKEIRIYPDESVKPPVGQGLNKEAVVTLHKIWPSDKTTKTLIDSINDQKVLEAMDYFGVVQRETTRQEAAFVDYNPETGSWIFKVEHFSKYGMADEVENLRGIYTSETNTSHMHISVMTGHGKSAWGTTFWDTLKLQ